MPLWGVNQSGPNVISSLNLVSIVPGDVFSLLDGTETIVTGSKSVAFSRGEAITGADAGSSFFITGCTNGTQITIQASNGTPTAPTLATLDASFISLPGGVFTGNNAYTDVGRAAFYRALVVVFVSGDVPVVIVKR